MVTKHIIPCSSCKKEVERYIYCSGACRVRGKREKDKGEIKKIKLDQKKIPLILGKIKAEPCSGKAPELEVKPKGKWIMSKIGGKKIFVE